ncbi:sugar ABC transporter ATP-binding protein [Aneurinibacillus danicus]|jgi:ribose transport system ATP-binding protein|uniref:Ribose import ATP-binding protein RbsA n=1 Tax=Aneurinibacillus danicus TaxID=267746 RepID=A0A511VBT7_9BACL|nr:sugar ABC transporter ATP-binding protein [Aneurinibacillus danicus]GEN36289.1 ribose import ATP-binding protein RbsA [Aneurinibacillus danicus]
MSEDYVLEMISIDKEFPGVKALQNVNFQLRAGEIHGLIGENGAGKSTLMKILAGIYSQDRGEIRFRGHIQAPLTPRLVKKLGIHFIHQERYVVSYLTVAESLFLGIEPAYTPLKLIKRRSMEREAERVLKETVGVSIPGNKLVGDLTVGEQQLLQICRALLQQPKVIVFDEPTAVLAKREAEQLFKIIRELRKKEIGIIYISHYLGEILDICDRITVLRNGVKVNTIEAKGVTIEDIVYMMAGRHIDDQFPSKNRNIGEILLDIKGLTRAALFRNVSFQIRSGEIVGITGLMGSGHTGLGMAIFDNYGITDGSIEFEGKRLSRINPERAVSLGMGYVHEDRRNLGIIQNMSVRENITLASLKDVSKGGVINAARESQKAAKLIEKLEIRTPSQEEAVNYLSGGNQQKVVIAKWLSSRAKLYILNQPTAAVDVGAKAEIYTLISQMAEQGAGVLLISQDLQELVGLCDRILVMYRGEIIQELAGDNLTTDQVMVCMMGGNLNDSGNNNE